MPLKHSLKIVAVISLALFTGAITVSAQSGGSGHFIAVSQGILTQESAYYPATGGSFPSGGVTYSIDIGSGWTGTTTGAFLTASTTISNGPVDLAFLDINGVGPTGNSQCQYSMRNFANGTYTGSDFRQLVQWSQTNDGCVLKADYDYEIRVSYVGITSATPRGFSFWGSATNNRPTWPVTQTGTVDTNVYIPYFTIVTNGFYITPSASSTDLNISGAQTFCNGIFASSTGIGATIANGFCIAAAFLVVPSASSIQNFVATRDQLGERAPFSWAIQTRQLLDGFSASSSENFINVGINFGTSTEILGFTSLDVISTTTIHKYLPDSTRESARALTGIVFYLIALGFIYRQVMGIWHKTV